MKSYEKSTTKPLWNEIMQDKLKVLLKRTPKSVFHSAYQELINYPPDNCVFLSDLETLTDRISGAATYYGGLPNIGISTETADLIHSHQMILHTKVPWLVDFEHADALMHFRKNLIYRLNKRIILKYLSSSYCKKIMPWSNAAKKSLERTIGISNIEKKIEVVYPAMHNETFKKLKNDKISLLFVGIRFIEKGGLEVLDAFEVLNKKYDDLELIIISKIPKYLEAKYANYKNVKLIKPDLSRDVLFKNYYLNSNIFVFPTHIDSFGMVLLEAKCAGLPIVTTDIYAMPEIVDDGINGFLLPASVSQYNNFDIKCGTDVIIEALKKGKEKLTTIKLIEKLSLLIEDTRMRDDMGKAGKKQIESGKFSIIERNKRLSEIYDNAVYKH